MNTDNEKKGWGLRAPQAVVLGVMALATSSANAEGWFWQPTASVFAEQNDNVRLSTTSKVDAASLGVSLAAALKRETPDSKVSLQPGLRMQRYSSNSDLDSTDISLQGSATQAYERVQLGATGAYVDSTTLTSEFEDSGNLRSRIDRTRFDLSPFVQYKLTPISSLKLATSYSKVNYEEGNPFGYYDYDQVRVDGTYSHTLTQRTQLSATVYSSQYKADAINNEATTLGGQLGMSYKMSEDTSFNGMVGGYSTDTDYTIGGVPVKQSASGALYSLGVSHSARLTTYSASLGRQILPSSTGEVRREDRLSFGINHKLTQRLELRGDAVFLDNNYLNANTNDRKYRSIGGGMYWHLDPLWTLSASYRNSYQKYDISNDTAESNRFNVSVIFNGLNKALR